MMRVREYSDKSTGRLEAHSHESPAVPSFCHLPDEDKFQRLDHLLDPANLPQAIFTEWNILKDEGYDTRANYKFDHGLVPKSGERANGIFRERKVYTPEGWRKQRRAMDQKAIELKDDPVRLERLQRYLSTIRVSRNARDNFEVVTKEIQVFHHDQMRPGNFRERTKALIKYGNVFWRTAKKSSYIKKNMNPEQYDAKWFTKKFTQRDFDLEPFEFFNEGKLHEHLNQRQIYGVKANDLRPQWWYGVDIDLHIEKGGRPAVFLKQVEAVLRFLHGKRWIVCCGRARYCQMLWTA
jgi:hypothetical protein